MKRLTCEMSREHDSMTKGGGWVAMNGIVQVIGKARDWIGCLPSEICHLTHSASDAEDARYGRRLGGRHWPS